MPRHTKTDVLETRERILDAAEKVIGEDGLALASLVKIARYANVTRRAIYGHFKDKKDLFDAVCERNALSMEHVADAIADSPQDGPLLCNLRAVCLSILQEISSNSHMHHTFTAKLPRNVVTSLADSIFLRRCAVPSPGKALLKRLISHAVRQCQLPPDLDVELAGTALHGALHGLLDDWLSDPGGFDLMSRADRLLEVSVDAMWYAPALRIK